MKEKRNAIPIYVKSLEEDFATKTMIGTKKTTCQTVEEIVKTKILKPNTVSFGREKRLSCTRLHKNYLVTYRPHGLIFTTDEKPDYLAPFDFALMTQAKKIIVQYYRIKNNLHLYYNHPLIDGFERYLFKDFETMIAQIASPRVAWKKVNAFRTAQGFARLPLQKYRLAQYNEAVFHHAITIRPLALYGYTKLTRKKAKALGLPAYRSAREFFAYRGNNP